MTLLDSAEAAVIAPPSTTPAGPASRVRRHSPDEYADVNRMLGRLATLSEGSAAWKHQREAVVIRCLPLAEHLARRFNGRGIEFDDLIQVARVGLVAAIDRFDLHNGADFLSFAVPTIRGELRRHFRDRGWAMRVPRRVKDLHVAISSAIPAMTQRLGRAPTASELATELDVDREDVVQTLIARDCYCTMSLDDPLRAGDCESVTLSATVGAPEPDYELVMNREALRALIPGLDDRQRAVLRMRFFESMTQSQIAERLGVSQMHVSRILARTLAELRDAMQ